MFGFSQSWSHTGFVAMSIAALQAVALIRQLGLQPRRTIRVVLWTNEENGSAGARAYRQWVGDEVGQHVAGIEPNDFRRNVAALAVLAYVLADMPERLVQ